MKLKTTCQKCKEDFDLKKSYLTRPEMIQEMGETFPLKCTHCNVKNTYHVNDVQAYNTISFTTIIGFIAIMIILLITAAFWQLGFITNIGLIIGAIVLAGLNTGRTTSNVRAFNSYKVRRRL